MDIGCIFLKFNDYMFRTGAVPKLKSLNILNRSQIIFDFTGYAK